MALTGIIPSKFANWYCFS